MLAVVVVFWPAIARRITLKDRSGDRLASPTATVERETDLPRASVLAEWYDIGHLIGSSAAPVQILEFGTFTCTFCRTFAAAVDTIQRRYPGVVSLRWIHYLPTDQQAGATRFMAEASECVANLSRFAIFYRKALLEGRWIESRSALISASGELGVANANQLLACMDSHEQRARLFRHARATEAIGDIGTPAWFVNGRLIVGAVSTAQLDSIVKREFRQ